MPGGPRWRDHFPCAGGGRFSVSGLGELLRAPRRESAGRRIVSPFFAPFLSGVDCAPLVVLCLVGLLMSVLTDVVLALISSAWLDGFVATRRAMRFVVFYGAAVSVGQQLFILKWAALSGALFALGGAWRRRAGVRALIAGTLSLSVVLGLARIEGHLWPSFRETRGPLDRPLLMLPLWVCALLKPWLDDARYALDLLGLSCDWFELTDEHGAQLLERTPFRTAGAILADRNDLRPAGVGAVKAGAQVVIRLRWTHSAMNGAHSKNFTALDHGRKLKVRKIGEWSVKVLDGQGKAIEGRVVGAKLPAPRAAQAERRTFGRSQRKGKNPDNRSLQAAHYAMSFTTLPAELLGKAEAMKRYCWQMQLAFKRLRELLKLWHLPHQDGDAARGVDPRKLLVARFLETLFRNAWDFSPLGHETPLPAPLGLDSNPI